MFRAQLLVAILGILLLTSCHAFLPSVLVTRSGTSIQRCDSTCNDYGICTQQLKSKLSSGGAARTVHSSLRDSRLELGGAAATGESRPRRHVVRALQATSGAEDETMMDDIKDLSGLRRVVTFGTWALLLLYVITSFIPVPWSPAPPSDFAKDFDIVQRMVDGENPLSWTVFNSVAVQALLYAPILIGGGAFKKGRQTSITPLPFVFGATFAGFFALAPYLALRNYVPQGDGQEPGILEKIFTNKILALFILAAASWCISTLVLGVADTAAREAYIEWFRTTDLMHVSSIDLSLMALFMVDPLREDMRRRGWKPDPARVAFFWVPIIGPALWLIVRPPVADGAA